VGGGGSNMMQLISLVDNRIKGLWLIKSAVRKPWTFLGLKDSP